MGSVEMDLVKTYQKRLQDGIAAVEHDITARTQQIEGLTKRLDGLKRALELLRSDQAAITELLRTSIEVEDGPPAAQSGTASPAAASAVNSGAKLKARVSPAKSATAFARSSRPPRQLAAKAQKAARTQLNELREANRNGKVKRTALIAAVLQGTPGLTVQELIAGLNQEFAWKCTASNLTGHLDTNPKMFTHTAADRAGKNPVRWSLK
jgi:hypothetical protein